MRMRHVGHGRQRGLQREALAVQQAVGLLDARHALRGKTPPAQPFQVQPAHGQRIAVHHHEGRNILRDAAGKARHDVGADA